MLIKKRKWVLGLISIVASVALVGCGNEESTSRNSSSHVTKSPSVTESPVATRDSGEKGEVVPTEETAGESEILIAYFSVPEDVKTDGIDANSGASIVVDDKEVLGAVQFLAKNIQDSTGGDLFEIKTKQQYPLDHEPLVDKASEEQGDEARPELDTHVENMADYKVIFLGYPNWWGDMPMPLYSFLEEYNLDGKTIIPFCSHGGSGFSDTVNSIAEKQPEATVSKNGFLVSRNSVHKSANDVKEWVKELGMEK